jgi:hypothetical protein
MEFPDDVLALIREYSRPIVSKEALYEYKRAMGMYWGTALKKKMTTPDAIEIVRRYNDTTDVIDEICREPGRTWRTKLEQAYREREMWGMEIRRLLFG